MDEACRRPAVDSLEARRMLSGLAAQFAVHAGPAAEASPGVPASFRATFDDPTPGPYQAVIDWGDGATSAGAIGEIDRVPGATGDPFLVSGHHAYGTFGTYTITLTVTDSAGGSAQATASASVAGLESQSAAIQWTAGAPFAPTTPVAYVTTSDPGARAADLSATIDWGDGTTSAGIIAPPVYLDSHPPAGSPASFTVEGGHTYRAVGTYAIHVAIADAAGHTGSTVSTAAIAQEALTTAGLPIASRAGVTTGPIAVANVEDSIPGSPDDPALYLRATVDWGDGTTSAGVFGPEAGVAPGVRTPGRLYGPFVVLGAHDYARAGSYMIHVTIVSVAGTTGSTTSSANVAVRPVSEAPAPVILPAHQIKAAAVKVPVKAPTPLKAAAVKVPVKASSPPRVVRHEFRAGEGVKQAPGVAWSRHPH